MPLYSGSLAEDLSTLRKLWPCTIAQIVRTIVEGSFKGPMRRLQVYVCEQWRTAKKRRAEPELLESVPSELPMPQEAEETSPPWNSLSSAQQESPMPVAKKRRQEPGFHPTVDVSHEDVTSVATTTLTTPDAGRSMPTAKTTQKMFEFPPVWQFDPTWICLVTRSMHPVTAVPCLLGFIGLVCGDDFEKVLDGADKDGLALEAVELSGAELRQRLSDLMIDWYPAVTMDDFYVLLGIQLCNLFCRRGSDVNCSWYQTRAGDLVELFPDVTGQVSVRLYDEAQADAICAFAERWLHTRAAIHSIILEGRFEGPMHRLQQYVLASCSCDEMNDADSELESFVSCDSGTYTFSSS